MLACSRDHVDIARMLLGEFHANIEIQNKDGNTVEDYAKSSSYCALFEALFVEMRKRVGYLLK